MGAVPNQGRFALVGDPNSRQVAWRKPCRLHRSLDDRLGRVRTDDRERSKLLRVEGEHAAFVSEQHDGLCGSPPRNLAMLGYWSREETWPLIGYGGPLLRSGERAT